MPNAKYVTSMEFKVNMPLISVIIPVYNAEKYVDSAINSILNQTYKNIEIIVVDDGSTDSTAEKIQKYGSRISYIYQQNGGPSLARNRGIEGSNGDYVAFLDADDFWFTNKLEKQATILIHSDSVGLVTCGRKEIDDNGFLGDTFMPPVNNYSRGRLIKELAIKNIIGGASAVLMRRSSLRHVGVFDSALSVSEDCDLWLRVAQRYDIACVQEVLFYYRLVPNSQSAIAEKNIQNQSILTKRLFHQGIISRYVYRKALSYKYFCAAWSSMQANRRIFAFAYILRSLFFNPVYFLLQKDMVGMFVRIVVGESLAKYIFKRHAKGTA